jgi:hypothetical protein
VSYIRHSLCLLPITSSSPPLAWLIHQFPLALEHSYHRLTRINILTPTNPAIPRIVLTAKDSHYSNHKSPLAGGDAEQYCIPWILPAQDGYLKPVLDYELMGVWIGETLFIDLYDEVYDDSGLVWDFDTEPEDILRYWARIETHKSKGRGIGNGQCKGYGEIDVKEKSKAQVQGKGGVTFQVYIDNEEDDVRSATTSDSGSIIDLSGYIPPLQYFASLKLETEQTAAISTSSSTISICITPFSSTPTSSSSSMSSIESINSTPWVGLNDTKFRRPSRPSNKCALFRAQKCQPTTGVSKPEAIITTSPPRRSITTTKWLRAIQKVCYA